MRLLLLSLCSDLRLLRCYVVTCRQRKIERINARRRKSKDREENEAARSNNGTSSPGLAPIDNSLLSGPSAVGLSHEELELQRRWNHLEEIRTDSEKRRVRSKQAIAIKRNISSHDWKDQKLF